MAAGAGILPLLLGASALGGQLSPGLAALPASHSTSSSPSAQSEFYPSCSLAMCSNQGNYAKIVLCPQAAPATLHPAVLTAGDT